MQGLALVRAAVVVAFTLVFAAAAYVGAERIIALQARAYLDEKGETALPYAELAVVSATGLLSGTPLLTKST